MKYLTVFLIATFWSFSLHAQTYEIGGFLGGSNFIGDVGSTTYINPNSPAYGAIFKWNRSARHSFRFTALFSNLQGDDAKSNEAARQERNFSFENSIKEFSLGIEYTFWEFDMFKKPYAHAPYLYSGVTTFQRDKIVFQDGILENNGGSWDFAVPIVLGYKFALNSKIVFAFEAGARYTFTDGIDGSDPADSNQGFDFGNVNNDDWYMFTGVTVTFAFGRKPCYCAF